MFVVIENNEIIIGEFNDYTDAADFADRYRHINDGALISIKEEKNDTV